MGFGKSQKKKEVILEAQRDKRKSPLCYSGGHMSPPKCGVRTNIAEVQRQSRALGGHSKKRLWSLRSLY